MFLTACKSDFLTFDQKKGINKILIMSNQHRLAESSAQSKCSSWELLTANPLMLWLLSLLQTAMSILSLQVAFVVVRLVLERDRSTHTMYYKL